MAPYMDVHARSGLERSCGDWIRIAPAVAGMERVEAQFGGRAYEPHRHDTYSIGYTLRGVQSFRYRGSDEHSLAGQVFVLHPDETHDGHAGTEEGFRYRILYVEPRAIQEALGASRRALPFVRDTVSTNRRIVAAIAPALADLDHGMEDLQRDQILAALADALMAADPSLPPQRVSPPHRRAVMRARELLDAGLQGGVTSEALEATTGLTRFALARHFRACLGTSPYRYLIMRRLDHARMLIRQGQPLAVAAAGSGFADQSHMTRHFRRIFGMSPGNWSALLS